LLEIFIRQDKDIDEPDQVMKIPLPSTLKKQLVDDWEFITQLGQAYYLRLASF
jgi:mortality factor 4-like protein 1